VKEVWLAGGPADGRLLTIEAAADGTFPAGIALDQAGVFLGARDQPAQLVRHRYIPADDTDDKPIYQYLGTAD
jgi:hypothetical protein